MKHLIALLQFLQIIALVYLFVIFMFPVNINGLLILFICGLNLFITTALRHMFLDISKANLELYKGFARRLGWEEIVSDLGDVDK